MFTLNVTPDAQGRGHGQALLATAFARLRELGHANALVWVLAANPSRFFYEAMGGRCIARRSEHFASTKLKELAYCWPEPTHRLMRRRDESAITSHG